MKLKCATVLQVFKTTFLCNFSSVWSNFEVASLTMSTTWSQSPFFVLSKCPENNTTNLHTFNVLCSQTSQQASTTSPICPNKSHCTTRACSLTSGFKPSCPRISEVPFFCQLWPQWQISGLSFCQPPTRACTGLKGLCGCLWSSSEGTTSVSLGLI